MKTILDKITSNTLWTTKYSPQKLDDLILHPITKKTLNHFINTTIKNCIFIGGSGSGKTITSKILARNIIPKEFAFDIFLNLNASDDRGLTMINNIIIPFIKKKYDKFPIKLIIINEAHTITPKAQSQISNLMDSYSNTKFIFISNELNDISDNIQSRCSILYFPIISYDNIFNKIKFINKNESVNLNDECLKTIIDITQRDLRQSINSLQVIKYIKNTDITPDIIYTLFDKPNNIMIKNLLLHIHKNNKDKIKIILSKCKNKGYSPNDILLAILNFIITIKTFDELPRDFIIETYKIVSKYYIRINKGTETWIQVYGCIAECINS